MLMPGMDGVEFIRRLAETGLRPSLILASGIEAGLLQIVEQSARAFGLPVLGILPKPLTRAGLEALLELWRKPEAIASIAAGGRKPLPRFSLEQIREGLERDEFEP